VGVASGIVIAMGCHAWSLTSCWISSNSFPFVLAGQTHLNCFPKLLQGVEYQHGYWSRPALAQGPSSKVIGRGMMGKGMKDMTLVLFPCQTFPGPFFSLVSGRSQILHFAAVRVKLLDASALFVLALRFVNH
jgi:hypothetical protein